MSSSSGRRPLICSEGGRRFDGGLDGLWGPTGLFAWVGRQCKVRWIWLDLASHASEWQFLLVSHPGSFRHAQLAGMVVGMIVGNGRNDGPDLNLPAA